MRLPSWMLSRLASVQDRVDALNRARETAALRDLDDEEVRSRGALAELARRRHLEFMKMTWQKPLEPMLVGVHTKRICEVVDRALEGFRAGNSTFLVISVPFRHGKSDLLSRYLPPRFLAEFPDSEVLLATYGQDLATDLSRYAKSIVQSSEFQSLFPAVQVSRESSAADRWGIEGHTGGMTATGLGGAMTGRGYALGIVDDFLKSREEAESAIVRDLRWQAFTSDFLTRRAPTSITLVISTRWSTDDPVARIEKAMAMDDEFPRFETLKFPALDPSYPTGTLFPERFPLTWYSTQRATLGPYGFAGLMQQQPVVRGGNMFKIDKIDVVELEAIPAHLRWVRSWDLASTQKQVGKRDPDYTVGVMMAVEHRRGAAGNLERHVWVGNIVRGQWEAPARDRTAYQVAEEDGPHVKIVVEAAGAYKDTLTRWKEMFRGRRSLVEYQPALDKVVRGEPLLAVVDAGNFHLLKAPWNSALIEEMGSWPYGGHDDQVDALVAGLAMAAGEDKIMGVFEYLRRQRQMGG